jgi:adenylate cyclase
VTERRIPPLPVLSEAAAATAPFPLPKVPVKVSQFWLFKGGAGDVATLPTVMFQLHTLAAWPDLLRLLREASPAAAGLPDDVDTLRRTQGLPRVMEELRSLLRQPGTGARVQAQLATDTTLTPAARRMLTALVRVYQDRDSRYLNYYGPPRAVTTLPYHEVWQADGGRGAARLDLRGKLVLVGFSERLQPEQKDGFYTVYSQEASGLDISGVEIAATALANMLEDNPVHPLRTAMQIALVFLCGLVAGLLAMFRRVTWSMAALAVAALVYLVVALQLFTAHALWLPLVLPLAIQVPAAGVAALVWRYRDVARERNRIRRPSAIICPSAPWRRWRAT